MIAILATLLFALQLSSLAARADTLLPYGADAGDTKMTTLCKSFPLGFNYKYYSFLINDTTLCKSGGLSMNDVMRQAYIKMDVHFLATLVSDANGEVFYRTALNAAQLAPVNAQISAIIKTEYIAENALVVTWQRVRPVYKNEFNTFQIMLTSNRLESYLVYNYGKIDSKPVQCRFFIDSYQEYNIPDCPNAGQYAYIVYNGGKVSTPPPLNSAPDSKFVMSMLMAPLFVLMAFLVEC